MFRVNHDLTVPGLVPSLVLPLILFMGVHEYSLVRGACVAFALGYLTDEVLTQQLARQFSIPIVDPSESEISSELLSLVPPSLIRRHLILPLNLSGSTLTVSMADWWTPEGGEAALGCNYAVTRHTCNTLFDEKIGGTFHLALGASYPESGGRNLSALHWDMVGDLRRGGRVEADGRVISADGRFLDPEWPRPG